jgi:hypothetical protein
LPSEASRFGLFRLAFNALDMPGMPINLWGVSPLYENESLKERSIPTVLPIDQVLDEGNCVRATKRGKEASKRSIGVATGSDIRCRSAGGLHSFQHGHCVRGNLGEL